MNPSGLIERYLGRQDAARRGTSRQQALGFFMLLTVTGLVAVFGGLLATRNVVRVYLLVAVAVGAAAVAAGTLSRFGRIERTRRQRSGPLGGTPLPSSFQGVERRLELASEFAGEFELLRPRLRQIAQQRLAGRGLLLESAEARRLLGENQWLLLERPPQKDKFASGPDVSELDGLLQALERI